MSNESNKLVLFIARASGASNGDTARTKARLLESLNYTREVYEKDYGQLVEGQYDSVVFVQGSNQSLRGEGETVKAIQDFMTRGINEKRPVVLAVNGWDGLSTSAVALVKLLEPYASQVQLLMRIFVGIPRIFRQVRVVDALKLLQDDYDGPLSNQIMPFSTVEFVRKINSIHGLKVLIAEDMARLREESELRNTPPKTGHEKVCPRCGDIFRNSSRLNIHVNNAHSDVPVEERTCPHCERIFARKAHLQRHLQNATCDENPDHVRKPPIKRAPRGSKSKTALREKEAVGSDAGYPSYLQISENTPNFPRVDPEAPFEERVVYKGEVFCRYPGSNCATKFSEPANLRTHYKAHSFEYPVLPRSITEASQLIEDRGLDWLARCAHYSSDNVDLVGQQPKRTAKRGRNTGDEEDDDHTIAKKVLVNTGHPSGSVD